MTRLSNLTETILAAGPKVADQVVSSLLKRKLSTVSDMSELESSDSKTVSLVKPRGGQNLQVTIGKVVKSTLKQQLFSVEDFRKLMTNLHLSLNKTIEIAKALRVASKNKQIVEPRLEEKLSLQCHSVDDFFSYVYLYL